MALPWSDGLRVIVRFALVIESPVIERQRHGHRGTSFARSFVLAFVPLSDGGAHLALAPQHKSVHGVTLVVESDQIDFKAVEVAIFTF